MLCNYFFFYSMHVSICDHCAAAMMVGAPCPDVTAVSVDVDHPFGLFHLRRSCLCHMQLPVE